MDGDIQKKLLVKGSQGQMDTKTRITPDIYNTVKLMLNGGATEEDVSKFKRFSSETLRRIKKTKDYSDYVELLKVYNRKQNERANKTEQVSFLTDDKQKGGTLSANYQINQIVEELKRQNDILTLLSNKVAFIVEELTGKTGVDE